MADALAALPPLREVIAAHGLSARKSLGQNFLFDGNLLDRIARVPGPLDGASVYEVGPGPGGLTRALLRAGARVTAVERDPRFLPALAELAAAADNRLSIVSADALGVDETSLVPRGTHVVANLPYNVGTALLIRWLSVAAWPPWWRSLTLMFQKEVAQRIVAVPGSDAYGRLAVLTQLRSHARIALDVPPRAFTPPPKVSSAVVHIVPGDPTDVDVRTVARLTELAFGQRRKMLRASLKRWPKAAVALAATGIDGERRAETLGVGDYVSLARWIERS